MAERLGFNRESYFKLSTGLTIGALALAIGAAPFAPAFSGFLAEVAVGNAVQDGVLKGVLPEKKKKR